MESATRERMKNSDEDIVKEIELSEYEDRSIEYSEEELDLLKKDKQYFNEVGKKLTHPAHSSIRFDIGERTAFIKNSAYFGDLLLPSGKQLCLKPKTPTVPLKLLNYSTGVECNDSKTFLYYDIDYSPTIPRGITFFSPLSEAYLREMKKILEKGFVREYVKKEENLDYLKGKLNFGEQVKKNFANPKFHCTYFDLTIDNFCNQMVLYAGYKLAQLLDNDPKLESVKSELFNYVEDLKNQITLRSVISPDEASNVTVTRKNKYYETILDISKMVIQEVFYQSKSSREAAIAYNYLIDMNVIFERTVYKLFSEVLEDFSYDGKYDISLEDQRRYTRIGDLIDLPEYKSLTVIPDITVLSEKGRDSIAVIDTKYKGGITNSDYYQILAYSLFLKNISDEFSAAILVHFEEKSGSDADRIEIRKGSINLSDFSQFEDEGELEDIGLYRISINIEEYEDEKFEVEELERLLRSKIRFGDDDWEHLKDSLNLEFHR